MDAQIILSVSYIIAAVLFILGLKQMSHPRSAVSGNLLSAVAMLVAILATVWASGAISLTVLLLISAAGTIVGLVLAGGIRMTAMPQLVGLFNGFGGLASVLVAGAALYAAYHFESDAGLQVHISIAVSVIIGALTFLGSMVAFGKLQGIVSEKPLRYPGEQVVKVLLFLAVLAGASLLVLHPQQSEYFWATVGAASLLGIMLVLPIGGADMPIVIALLNSYSGLAAAATGFVLDNSILIIAGSLVGASGIILTRIMCRAMNRSLANVLFGGLGAVVTVESKDDIYAGAITSTSPEEVAMILHAAQRVVFIPGYGMAVARAQTAVRQLSELLQQNGVEVLFGIHPVAGRMPGHMNVLLAEENIDYDMLLEMDQANMVLPNTDVAIVIGANDVVNPSARDAAGSPIAGMPILDADKARTVIVIKRSLSPGFAGVANPLFAADNTLMLFGDGKKMAEELATAYKDV